jgi:hypothetical protein
MQNPERERLDHVALADVGDVQEVTVVELHNGFGSLEKAH